MTTVLAFTNVLFIDFLIDIDFLIINNEFLFTQDVLIDVGDGKRGNTSWISCETICTFTDKPS